MAKKEDAQRRKLIDRLLPDEEKHGPLLGLLGTTFELSPEFVETDLLPTLFGLGGWDDRSWSSRIALEGSLAQMEGAAVLMDARRYHGRPRSLRLELLPGVGEAHRLLHAKVLLLVHERGLRLLVGSANLTENGYRLNREAAAMLAVTADDPRAGGILRQALADLPERLAPWWTEGCERLRDMALERLEGWGAPQATQGVRFIWSGDDMPLWRTFVDAWPANIPIDRVSIVSPFWATAAAEPVRRFVEELAARSGLEAGANVHLFAEAGLTEGDGPRVPPTLGTLDLSPFGASADLQAVDPRVPPEEVGMPQDFRAVRSLHAKVVVVEGGGRALAYVGSANFSARGWGFAPGANIEAGLLVHGAPRELRALLPAAWGAPLSLPVGDDARLSPPQSEPDPEAPWPAFLKVVALMPTDSDSTRLDLRMEVLPDRVAGDWQVWAPDGTTMLASGRPGMPTEVVAPVADALLGSLLIEQEVTVRWWAHEDGRRVPINVDTDARQALPIAPEAQRPNEALLVAYYQGRVPWEHLFPPPSAHSEADEGTVGWAPEDTVDTARIQSYQVREFVEALRGVEADLRAASQGSSSTHRMALVGPVSPVALAREIVKAVRSGARTATAGAFQLVELEASLRAAARQEVADVHAVSWRRWTQEALTEVRRNVDQIVAAYPELSLGSFARYRSRVDGLWKEDAA